MTEYNDDSIDSLEGEERLRRRPEAVLGSKGIEGAMHGFTEILGNALDERSSGYGDRIEGGVEKTGHLWIRDYGRGVPMGWNKAKGRWNWDLVFCELYAGGKYDDKGVQEKLRTLKTQADWDNFDYREHSYLFSVGLNGLGATATQYTSRDFQVISYRNGKASEMRFERGKPIWTELTITDTEELNGTYIRWMPDDEVFSAVRIDPNWVRESFERMSYISNLETAYYHGGRFEEGVKVDNYSARNIRDLVMELAETEDHGYREDLTHIVDGAGDICVMKSEIAIAFGKGANRFFHNQVKINGGSHQSAANEVTHVYFRDLFRKDGIKLKPIDTVDILVFVMSTFANKQSYRGQTKDSVDDTYIFNGLYDSAVHILEDARARREDWILEAIATVKDKAEKRAEVEALRSQVLAVNKATRSRDMPEAFVGCKSYGSKPKETELWLLEGKSASNSFKNARDAQFQCFFPLRGKSLNVFKKSLKDIFNNEEIKGLISILGCGVDIGLEDMATFDMKKLKVDKVIFASDADIDGYHIRILLFLIFYKLFPELLFEGKVYVAETPLYGITDKNNKMHYAYDEETRTQLLKELGGPRAVKKQERYKGLGQVDAPILRETTVHPSSRRLKQIKIDRNDMEVYDVVEVLFGKSTARRKEVILTQLLGVPAGDLLDELTNLDDMIAAEGFDGVQDMVDVSI